MLELPFSFCKSEKPGEILIFETFIAKFRLVVTTLPLVRRVTKNSLVRRGLCVILAMINTNDLSAQNTS